MRALPPKEFVSRELELDLRRNRVIVPSRSDPWFGRWARDAVLTEEQLHQLAVHGLDPDAPRLDVHIRTTAQQLWVPIGTRQPCRCIPCPIVGKRSDGRLKVITPNGDRMWIWPTGDVRKPWPYPAQAEPKQNIGGHPA